MGTNSLILSCEWAFQILENFLVSENEFKEFDFIDGGNRFDFLKLDEKLMFLDKIKPVFD